MHPSSDAPRSELPVRASHSFDQTIVAPPDAVFPLLCPVRERDWVPGWKTDWVLSESGVAETGCVFQTPGEERVPPALWVVTEHDPAAHRVAMVKFIPGHTVTRLDIGLSALRGERTRARIRYEFTALSPAGEDFVAERTAGWYEDFMRDWETAMNDYLLQARSGPEDRGSA